MRDHRSLRGLQVNSIANHVLTTIFGFQFVQTVGFILENRPPIKVEHFLFGTLILGTAAGSTRDWSRSRGGGGGKRSSPLLVKFYQQVPPICAWTGSCINMPLMSRGRTSLSPTSWQTRSEGGSTALGQILWRNILLVAGGLLVHGVRRPFPNLGHSMNWFGTTNGNGICEHKSNVNKTLMSIHGSKHV